MDEIREAAQRLVTYFEALEGESLREEGETVEVAGDALGSDYDPLSDAQFIRDGLQGQVRAA